MNAKGSKSAPTKKSAKTPAVTLDTGTTVVLPNPAEASAGQKPGRKKKEPPVATKAEVPSGARQAEAGPPLSNAVELPPPPEADAPKPKGGRPAKTSKTSPAQGGPTATPGSLRAIGDGWIESLRAAGHTPSTISSYGNDLEIAYEHLGAEAVAAEITEKQIAGFNACKDVTRKENGKPKAQPTILKTRRALRLALTWAEQQKLITKAPYANKTRP